MKKILAILFISLFIFSGCRPDPIDIDLPPHKQKLVVHSQVVEQEGLLVSVSKSFSSLSAPSDSLEQDSTFLNSIVVDHAYVTLTSNGITDVLQRVGPGLYALRHIRHPYYSEYRLSVRDSVTGMECSSSAQLLPPVSFKEVNPEVKRGEKDSTVYINFKIADLPETGSYYAVSVISAKRKRESLKQAKFFGLKQIDYELFLFTEKQFKASEYQGRERIEVSPQDTIVVTLSNISESHFRYLQLYQKTGSYYHQVTGEPINLPTNIHNGYGFFNTSTPTAKTFDLSLF